MEQIKFEWTITLGSLLHLVMLIGFLWWVQWRGFQRMKKAEEKLNEIATKTNLVLKAVTQHE